MPRRIRYVQNLRKLASMLEKHFEKATREDIEKVVLLHGRLDLAGETKGLFKVMTKRFYRRPKDPSDAECPPEVKWIKTTSYKNHNLLPEELLTEAEVAELVKAAAYSRDRAFVSMPYDSGADSGAHCDRISRHRGNLINDAP
jgi:hypothetical protein